VVFAKYGGSECQRPGEDLLIRRETAIPAVPS
jgi:hypothetical protein